ncbi:MAG TPA: 5-(carboxyamino)imidazole ribonucleotide synthase, partial [Bacillales bacterium]|nr:5-(carboxyamino)imidazole ribonucleotide synthase [Bacillales bacterium]
MIEPGKTIGILGGGQLGRMMAISAREMGYRIAVLEPKSGSPCGQIADHEVITAYDDMEGAKQLAEISDVITYEFENVDLRTAEWLETNANLPSGSRLLQNTQDREFEKKAIVASGCEVAKFAIIHDADDLREALKEIGFPSVIKTCRGGYDGKGQIVLRGEEDVEEALNAFVGKQKAILEQWVPFEKELSVIVTRSTTGEVKTFPVAENIHRDNILHQTIVPARISREIDRKATEVALKLAKSFELVGTLAVEMFLTKDGEIFVNEMAPRPHNSGHFTIDACETSQFQQHIRAICGWPLGETTLLKPAVMVNILGEDLQKSIDAIPKYHDVKYHLYGKDAPKPKRKMGHVTVLGDTIEKALEKADQLQFGTEA